MIIKVAIPNQIQLKVVPRFKSMFLAIQLNFRLVIYFIITKLAEYFYRATAI